MHSEMAPLCQNPLQRTIRTAHLSMLMTVYGTVCRSSCESRTLHTDNLDEHSKCIYLVTDSCSAK